MSEWVHLTVHQLAQAIRERKVSAVEVVQAHLNHIAQHNPALNAIVTLDEERALQRAKEADAALARGEMWGPLHGVPVTIKDAFETAGLRTTSSFPPLAHYVPKQDATIVARLRAAGAIILGKTNMPILTVDIQTNSPLFGRANNPWDLGRTTGGSTGGGAAAVAAGLSPLEVGSDGGGSIRIPSHFCGVFGLKPTEHLVPGTGHIPDLPGAPKSCAAHVLPLARWRAASQDLRLCLCAHRRAGRPGLGRAARPAGRSAAATAAGATLCLDGRFRRRAGDDGDSRGAGEAGGGACRTGLPRRARQSTWVRL